MKKRDYLPLQIVAHFYDALKWSLLQKMQILLKTTENLSDFKLKSFSIENVTVAQLCAIILENLHFNCNCFLASILCAHWIATKLQEAEEKAN